MPLKTTAGNHGESAKGRGSTINPEGRFEKAKRDAEDDGWYQEAPEGPSKPRTVVTIERVKSIITRNDSPDIGFDRSINPYRGCEHGCTYCSSGDTPILLANGQAVPIAELRIGDVICGTRLVNGRRLYVTSRVLDHWSVVKPAFRTTLADGRVLVTSADHRFLAEHGWKHVTAAADRESYRPHLTTLDRLMGVATFQSGRGIGQARSGLAFSPAELQEANVIGTVVTSDESLRIAAVEPLGRAMRLFDITTETEDFIANGVVSHNCYARPSHAYLGLSPGIDFETKLFAKPDAAQKLLEELAAPSYRVQPIAIGVNTDAYQPIEREYKTTRSILEVLEEVAHPAYLITKNALIERDIDLLASMARRNLVSTTLTLVTLDKEISRKLEPRASAPWRRLQAVERLAAAGIPVNVNIAPVIPFLTDSELESILEAAKNAGATSAMYTLLRLPWEVKDIFRAWLEEHYPLKAAHVMSRVHQMRGGKDNDPEFGSRMSGQGLFADLLGQRFGKACAKLGLNKRSELALDCTQFKAPARNGQGHLF